MRLLELVFLASLVLAGSALFIAPERRSSFLRFQPALAITLALVHVFIDHGRWQLYLAYGVAGLISIAGVYSLRTREAAMHDRPWARRLAGVGIIAVALASAAVAWVIPVFSLPEPSGQHKVGTRWIALTDSSRDEALAPEPGEKRQLVVRLWFPADSVAGTADDYVESAVAKATAQGLGFPRIVLSHLPLVASHSFRRAWLPATPARFPLILFSHGYAVGTESQNTVQMEELASHGFVVASIAHPYESAAIVMPGSKVVTANLPLDVMGDTVMQQRMAEAGARVGAARDTTETAAALRDMYALSAPLETSIVRWTDDTRFVLDRLTAMTAMSAAGAGGDSLLVGRVDTERVGVLGMSFGGATAANFCATDARCAAGMNLDGLLYGIAAREPLSRPFFFASAEETEKLHRLFYERAAAPSWLMTVRGSKHMDYTDFSWIAPRLTTRAGMLGGIAPDRMHALMNAVIVPFFDAALRGAAPIDAAALQGRFPEMKLEARAGTTTQAIPLPTADSASARVH